MWTYDAATQTLSGPEPKPEIPPITSITAGELGASNEHKVAEVDQDVGIGTLAAGYIDAERRQQNLYCEHAFFIPNWKRCGWYAQFKRSNSEDDFVLTHVWADDWSATHFTPWC